MKAAPYIDPPHRQRGDALFEALIAVVLASVIGLGLTYAAARMANSQRYMNAQNTAVHEMREELLKKGFTADELCDADNLEWNGSSAYTPSGDTIAFDLTCESTTITVNGIDIQLQAVKSLSSSGNDASQAVFGGDGELRISVD